MAGQEEQRDGQGGQVVGGFNAPNRVVLTRDARPGDSFQIAVFGINGPISASPHNYIWMRTATLDFEAASPDAVLLTPAHQFPTGVPLHPSRRQALEMYTRNTAFMANDDDRRGTLEAARIKAMYGTTERTINFKHPIPVYVTYQTAFTDDAGKPQRRADIYVES